MQIEKGKWFSIFTLLFLTACGQQPWNDPYPESEAKANIYYASFSASPKTLDPAKSYSTDESIFTYQIYEPPLQYHFLKRPYELVPLSASTMPVITYRDQNGNALPDSAPSQQVTYTTYDIVIKPGIYYQPHPAFAKHKDHGYYYHKLNTTELKDIDDLEDFSRSATRELVAEDFVYEIKRLAQPGINSPVYGVLASKILGLTELSELLKKNVPPRGQWLDLRRFPLSGVKLIDRYHYQITIKGKYPQFIYWLAMAFFAPIPWEVDAFYSQVALQDRNITFDWYPVGTGAYYLAENNPNRRMVLMKNPNYHEEYFPSEGDINDRQEGYLSLAGNRLPMIDAAVFTLEKESIPRWNKFLQGYYDQSLISSDSFDQAIQVNSGGQPYLTPAIKQKGVYLQSSIAPAISYLGFNMLDKIIGGDSERARKLRLAISIAIDYEEYINIFLNGRGMPAQGPIPPGIFGYQEGALRVNPYVYELKNNTVERQSILKAKQLLQEAGYANGIDPATGTSLILNYDLASTSGPDEKAYLGWIREQFAKIGIQLNIRNTEYNRFQDKMRHGEGQIFAWGWVADYPDPENFLFLLYGPNGKARFGGENATNYDNKAYDRLFDEMKNLPNNTERQAIINKMLAIVRHDSPWVWGYYQEDFVLSHVWKYPLKPNAMTHNTLKYQKLNPTLRNALRNKWNRKIIWPLGILMLGLVVMSLPVFFRYWQKERRSIKN